MQELKEKTIPLSNVRICYSPFARTSHTAEVVASVLNIPFEGPQCKVSYFAISTMLIIEKLIMILDQRFSALDLDLFLGKNEMSNEISVSTFASH